MLPPDDPRSPVWGGLTIALLVGLLFGGVAVLFGWGEFGSSALRAGAVVFALLALITVPGNVLHIVRRTPWAARVTGELFWEVLISAVLIYVAFVVA